MASKYGYGINADKALKDELVEFVQITMYLHNKQDLTNTDLWTVFQEQYKGFIVESFKKIYTNVRFKLQKHLLKRGVYIGKNSNQVTIYKLLYKVLQQEEQYIQTNNKLADTLVKITPMIIVSL